MDRPDKECPYSPAEYKAHDQEDEYAKQCLSLKTILDNDDGAYQGPEPSAYN